MKKKTIISKLIHKITFLKNLSTDEISEAKWEEFQVSFAEVKPVCDNRFVSLEGLSFGNVITEEYFLFRTRFIKNINIEMRISFHGKLFEVKRIINEEEKGREGCLASLV